jgi:hypothetical protein
MEKIKAIHDTVGQTLTVWFDDPQTESVSEETAEEVVLMKNATGRVIGFELLHYSPSDADGLVVETILRSAP